MRDNSEVIVENSRQRNALLNKWRKRASAKSIGDIRERLDEFFEQIERVSIVPTLDLLGLCLGKSKKTIYNYRMGSHCSSEVSALINAAVAQIDAIREIGVDSGTISPIYEIWYQKSRRGYSDQAGQSERERMTHSIVSEADYLLPSEILERHMKSLPDNGSEALSDALSASHRAEDQQAVSDFEYSVNDEWLPVPDDFDEDNVPFWMPDTTNMMI